MPDDDQLAEVEFGAVARRSRATCRRSSPPSRRRRSPNAESPIEQVRALETFLAEGGFFSHGLEGEVLSRAGHTSERITTLIGGDQMIGDDEQYAVAMALLAGELGIPVRVVMGYYPDEEQDGEAGLHRHRRQRARLGRGQLRRGRMAPVQPDAARGPGSERPEHQAAGRPEAAGAAAAAPAAGARRPAADAARRPRVRGRDASTSPASSARSCSSAGSRSRSSLC